MHLPVPCCTVVAVISVTKTVMLTTDATSRNSGRATLTSPVARFTVKNSCKEKINHVYKQIVMTIVPF